MLYGTTLLHHRTAEIKQDQTTHMLAHETQDSAHAALLGKTHRRIPLLLHLQEKKIFCIEIGPAACRCIMTEMYRKPVRMFGLYHIRLII